MQLFNAVKPRNKVIALLLVMCHSYVKKISHVSYVPQSY